MNIFVQRDIDAEVWVATSEDIPGLVTEAGTPNELCEKLLQIVPDLLELNADLVKDKNPKEIEVVFKIPFETSTEHSVT